MLASARAENAAAASALAAAAADAGTRLQAALRESDNPGALREQVCYGVVVTGGRFGTCDKHPCQLGSLRHQGQSMQHGKRRSCMQSFAAGTG